MQASEAQSENPELEYPDNESVISAPSAPLPPVNPSPSSPPTVYLHPPPLPDAQERQDRRKAWVTQPNYGGWGDDKARYLWRFIGRRIWFYVREDWVELPLTWDGVEGRDTIVDGFDDEMWAEWQLYRCSPHAADYNVGPPTFTGPQVLQRSQAVDTQLQQLHTQSSQLSAQLSAVEAEIGRYKAVAENMKDLNTLAHGLRRN